MAMTAEQVTLMMRELMDSQRQASAELQKQQTEAILANQTVAAKAAEDANAQLMDSMKKFMAEQTEQIKGKGTATAEQTPDEKELNEGQNPRKESSSPRLYPKDFTRVKTFSGGESAWKDWSFDFLR